MELIQVNNDIHTIYHSIKSGWYSTYETEGGSKDCSTSQEDQIVFLLFLGMVVPPVTFWLRQLIEAGWWSNIFIMMVMAHGTLSYGNYYELQQQKTDSTHIHIIPT